MKLFVVHPRSGRSEQLWPRDFIPEGLLQEGKVYWLEVREIDLPDSLDLYVDFRRLQALRSPNRTTARWEWLPDFFAGRALIRVTNGADLDYSIPVTIDANTQKLTRAAFENMVRDILSDTTALFGLAGFKTGVARGNGETVPPLARLEYLRSRIDALEDAIHAIISRPRRSLSHAQEILPTSRANNVRQLDILRSWHKSRYVEMPPGAFGVEALTLAPEKVRISSKSSSVDTPENRAIKTALEAWSNTFDAMASQLVLSTADPQVSQYWMTTARGMALRLRRLLSNPFFAEVGAARVPLRITPVFTKVPEYTQFLAIHRDLNLGISRVEGDFLDLPLNRTFELYELWVFLRLTRAATESYNLGIDLSKFFSVSDAALGVARLSQTPVIAVSSGIALKFQASYREYWTTADHIGTFSRTMRPDISIETNDRDLILLDAKYRVDTQINEAISSIHTYRDAIVRDDGEIRRAVRAAYIITPDSFDVTDPWTSNDMPKRLFHPVYRGSFRFGALTLAPGGTISDAKTVLSLVINDALPAS